MTRILIVYGSSEGQTAEIAEAMAGIVREHGHEAVPMAVKEAAGEDLADYDGVLVGASVHIGKHDKHVVKFVQRNLAGLERLPSAFFSVSLAAHGDTEEAHRYVDEFTQQTGWDPAKVAIFSGALRYTKYGFVKRRMMKKIAEEKPGSLATDTSRDHIYTEWDEVGRYAEEFLADLTTVQR